MSSTTPTHVDTSIPEVWARKTFREQLVDSFWSRFTGPEGSGAAIIQRSELLNNPGDLMHMQVTSPLAGAGVSGDTTALEGSEENLTTSEIKASPLLYRHGVRRYRRAGKKSIIDLQEEAMMRLAEWGRAKMDSVRFAQFVATAMPAPLAAETYAPNILVANGGTTVDDIAAGDKLTVDRIRFIRYNLRNNLAKPYKVNGLPFYFGVISPEMAYDLKNDTQYDGYATSAANRGMDNPVFTGALCNIDGVVLFEHPDVPVANNATSVAVAKSIFFGSEAFVEALDEDVTWVQKTFDYDNELGVAYSFAFQPRRALELSSVQFYCESVAATAV